MKGYIHLSGWLDNVAIMAVFVVVGALAVADGAGVTSLTWAMAVVSAALVAIGLAWMVRRPVPKLPTLARQVVRLGTPMMFFRLAQLLLFGTARIAIGKALGLDDVASFSVCARIALLLVFINQVLNIGLFRSVYRMEIATIGRAFSLWIVALAGLGCLVAVVGRFAGPLLVAGTGVPASALVDIFPLVVIQTLLWILNSNLELFVVRELLSRQAATACILVVALGLVVGVSLFEWRYLSLSILMSLYCLGMCAMLIIQMLLLSRKGVVFRHAYAALPLVASPGLLYLFPASA
jgi:hypothetical protein